MLERIADLETSLQNKRIRISKAGSIAEAAANITQFFSAAPEKANLYLHEIACMREETPNECTRRIEEAKQKADKSDPD